MQHHRKTFLGWVTILILLVFAVQILAVDDQGNPNDPGVNERANACYDGGSMEGKCTSDAEWAAGWYLIRVEYGLISRDDVPSWATWVLPPEPEIVTPPPVITPVITPEVTPEPV